MMNTVRRQLLTAVLLLSMAAIAFGADVNGKWVGETQGRGGQTQTLTITLKVEGNTLTGTVATPRGETPISDGKIDGDTISFTQTIEFNGNTLKFLYTGKVSGDQIQFKRQREGGQGRVQEFTAKRLAS